MIGYSQARTKLQIFQSYLTFHSLQIPNYKNGQKQIVFHNANENVSTKNNASKILDMIIQPTLQSLGKYI